MALTTREQRAALLDVASAKSKRTSFTRQLTAGPTILSVSKRNTADVTTLKAASSKDKPPAAQKPDVRIAANLPRGTGFHPNGFYFDLSLTFALGPQTSDNTPVPAIDPDERTDWGRHFGNPLVNPHKDTIYMVRLTLSQLRVEPLLGGFIIHWIRPRNWAWIDGQGTDTPIQVASNPAIVTRLVRSPATTIPNSGFQVRVKSFYP